MDRLQRSTVSTIASNHPAWESPFQPADVLWNKMKQNLKNYVNANGGSAIVNTNKLYRPDWNKVKDVLMGVKPISVLGCE